MSTRPVWGDSTTDSAFGGAGRSGDLPVAILAAVPLELAPLRELLTEVEELEIGRKPAITGLLDGSRTLLFAAGMGKVNAAQGLTALLEARPVRGVIGTGVAGAYAGSGLAVGDVALASAEVYGDEGVEAPGVWLSTREIGIPLLADEAAPRYNEFPLDADRVEGARQALDSAGVRFRVGPFVTVSSCSGTARRGAELAARYGGICESMEGAALAHVCALYRTPFLALRGISNLVEDRDLSRWHLETACAAASRAVPMLLSAF